MRGIELILVSIATTACAQPRAAPAGFLTGGPAPIGQSEVADQMRAEADAVQPLVGTGLPQLFLQAARGVPVVAPRHVFSDADHSHWYTAAQADALPAETRSVLTPRDLDEAFYWNTRYGTPVAYARAVDLAAKAGLPFNARVVDFGCGGLGAPRLLAMCGCRVVGVDVDPLLPALYSEPGDTGTIRAPWPDSPPGTLGLVTGQWPADASAVAAVRAALPDGVDLFLSKNTLKRGYVHPSEPTDPRRLVHLGVDDATFVAAVAQSLRPGGLFVIYNLCPAPAAPGQPYIPWADGHCPFPRELLEGAGLQVLDFDVVDDAPARQLGHALGWDQGDGAMDLAHDLFAWFTIARRPRAEGVSQPK